MDYTANRNHMTNNNLSHSSVPFEQTVSNAGGTVSRRNMSKEVPASLAIEPPSPALTIGNSSLDEQTEQPTSGHIARPRNAFMIYRSEFLAGDRISRDVEKDNRHISRIIGHCWQKLLPEEKLSWHHKAELEKIAHREKHPNYKFSPVPRAKKPLKRKGKRNGEKEMERCRQVADLLLAGKEGDELAAAIKRIELETAEDNDEDISETPGMPGMHGTPEMLGASYAYYPPNDSHNQVFMNPLRPPRPPPAPNANFPSVNASSSAYYPNTYRNNPAHQQQYYPSPPESPASPNYMYSDNAYALHPTTFYQQQSTPISDARSCVGPYSPGPGYSPGPSQGHMAYVQSTGYQFTQTQHGRPTSSLDSFMEDGQYYTFSPPSSPPTSGPSRHNFNNNFSG